VGVLFLGEAAFSADNDSPPNWRRSATTGTRCSGCARLSAGKPRRSGIAKNRGGALRVLFRHHELNPGDAGLHPDPGTDDDGRNAGRVQCELRDVRLEMCRENS
jgi:hypothetical protein